MRVGKVLDNGYIVKCFCEDEFVGVLLAKRERCPSFMVYTYLVDTQNPHAGFIFSHEEDAYRHYHKQCKYKFKPKGVV